MNQFILSPTFIVQNRQTVRQGTWSKTRYDKDMAINDAFLFVFLFFSFCIIHFFKSAITFGEKAGIWTNLSISSSCSRSSVTPKIVENPPYALREPVVVVAKTYCPNYRTMENLISSGLGKMTSVSVWIKVRKNWLWWMDVWMFVCMYGWVKDRWMDGNRFLEGHVSCFNIWQSASFQYCFFSTMIHLIILQYVQFQDFIPNMLIQESW